MIIIIRQSIDIDKMKGERGSREKKELNRKEVRVIFVFQKSKKKRASSVEGSKGRWVENNERAGKKQERCQEKGDK